VLSQVAKLI